MPVCIRAQEIREDHMIHRTKNVIAIQSIGDACVNAFLVCFLWRFRLPADPSGYIISGNQLTGFIIRRMDTRDFSRERKCAGIKDASTEYIQAECIFFAFLPVFCRKVLSAKIPF